VARCSSNERAHSAPSLSPPATLHKAAHARSADGEARGWGGHYFHTGNHNTEGAWVDIDGGKRVVVADPRKAIDLVVVADPRKAIELPHIVQGIVDGLHNMIPG
jgi:hypothetical protein